MASMFEGMRAGYCLFWLFNVLTIHDNVQAIQGWTEGITKICHGERLHISQVCPPTPQSSVVASVTINRLENATSTNQNFIVTDTQGYVVTSSHFNASYRDSGYYLCNITLINSDENQTISRLFQLDVILCRPTIATDIKDQGCGNAWQVSNKYFSKEGEDITICWHLASLENNLLVYTPNGSIFFNMTAFEAVYSESLTNILTPVGNKQKNTVGIALHHVTLANAGEYHVISDGVTENVTTLFVFGWLEQLSSFSVNVGSMALFNWAYDQSLRQADSVTVEKRIGNDSKSVLEVTSQVGHNESGRVSYLGNAAFSLSDINLSDSGTYRCQVTFVVPEKNNSRYILVDEVELTVTEGKPQTSSADYPLITGMFILMLVLLIPIGICTHICCGKSDSRAMLNPVNMHHGVLHDTSRGSSLMNLSTELDPMLLHDRILAIRRARIGRSRTVSEATVASANDLWFGHHDFKSGSQTPDENKPHKIHFNAVKECDDSQSV